MPALVDKPHLTIWQVPLRDQMPCDELIEWLNSMPNAWEGDENGVSIQRLDAPEEWMLVDPGGYIVENRGVWTILTTCDMRIVFEKVRVT
jgi:hypothetical protein